MKILTFTFSGTGNTYLTADFISDALKANGAQVTESKMEGDFLNKVTFDFKGVDHIVIGYPIHAFNAQKAVIDVIKRFPISTGQKVSIFKTAGEPFYLNRSSSAQIIKILAAKGYEFLVETHFLMPYNIMFRYDDSLAKQMYLFMQKMAIEFAYKIVSGTQDMIKYSLFGRVISVLIRPLMWWGAKFNGKLYSVNKNKCTMCMKCVRECPTQNIKEKSGKIYFGWNCAMCMRCSQRCKTDAINIGLLRFWNVNGEYEFEKLAADDSVRSDFVNENTKGYFRAFRKFFDMDTQYKT